TPELAQTSTEGGVEKDPLDYHFIHGFKPPPPYPYSKPSSNSTPDLASASKCEEASIEPYGSKKRLSLLTSSLGCLGSPELSRTYENLSELTDAVESLRLELTKGESSFLHSFAPNYSTDNLDAIYQLSNGRVAALEQNSGLKNLAPSASFNGYIPSNTGSSSEEPIYQNVGTVLSDIKPDRRGRAKSAPELDAEDSQKSEEALLRSSYESAAPGTGIQFLAKFNNSQNHAFAIHQLQTQPQHSVQTQAQQQKVVTQSQQIQQNSSQHQEKALQQQQHVFNTALSQNQSILISQSQQQLLQAHRQQQQQQQQFLQNQTHQQSQKQLHQQQTKSNFSQQHLAQAQQHPSQPQLQLQQPPNLSKAKIQLQSSQQVPQQQFQNISSQHSTSTHTMAQQQLQHPVQHLPQTHMNSQQNLLNNISSQTKDYHSPARKGRKSLICSEDSKKLSTVAFPLKDNGAKPDLLMESFSSYSNKDPKAIELEEKIASMDIVREYESIPRIKNNPDFTSALRSENVPRNRYKDIVPYEENRVKITPSKDNKAGYVNASHITASVGDTQRFYICAQGPLPTTVAHFWQCVWETDVRLLVMLAAVEGDTNTSKSFPYWPQIDNTSVECDQFRIYRKHSTKSGFHVTSRLQLVQMSQRKSRSVWHLQFTDWADHGCPEDVHSFLSFLEELATLRRLTFEEIDGIGKNRNTPVLVHCSAGVGRSGVTILCDLLMEAAKHNLPLNPPKILTQLRQQRMALVQSFNQYKFVYKVLLALYRMLA
ncbi:Tyrosine-protein phosphatase non-receptor type 14, partial [Armadillidium vulgare]